MTINFQIKKSELIYLFFGVVVLAFVFFGNGIKGQFVYDDNLVIGTNPTITQFSKIPEQFASPYHYMRKDSGLYRPLTVVSFTFDFLFGKSPAGFHVVNILLHALNVFLVFLLILKLFSSRRLAYVASALFFFLPIHTEAVTFISGRADLLAFSFALISLLLLFDRKYWWGVGAFLLGLLSKESVVLLVPLVFVFWLWTHEKALFKNIFAKALFFLPPAVIYGLLRYAALKNRFLSIDSSFVYNPLKFTDILSRFYTALKVMLLYLWKTFVPLHLSADYSFNQIPVIHSFGNIFVVSGLILLAVFIMLAIWKKSRATPLGWGSAIFLSSFFVVSNFVFPIGTIMAERTFYLPSLGIALISAFGLHKLMSWKFQKLWITIFALILIFYGVAIINRNKVWASKGSLFEDMAKESPNSVHAQASLGEYYIQNDRWAEGKKLLQEAYDIYPNHIIDLNALGIVAEHEGRYQDAEKFYLAALKVIPGYSTAISNLGRMYYQIGRYKEAADILLRQINYSPDPKAVLFYSLSESKLRNFAEAISIITKYYGDNPTDINLKFALGYAYYKKGNRAMADIYFKQSKNPAISDEEFIRSLENF